MHIGSGTDLEHLSQVCGALERVALAIGETITTISAGGGLPTPYRATDLTIDIAAYFRLWDATRRRLQDAFGHRRPARNRAWPLPRRRERIFSRRDPGRQADGLEHVLPPRRGLQ